MRTKPTIILAFVANIMSAQMLTRDNEALDTLCQTKFTAVYLYTMNQTSKLSQNSMVTSIASEEDWRYQIRGININRLN